METLRGATEVQFLGENGKVLDLAKFQRSNPHPAGRQNQRARVTRFSSATYDRTLSRHFAPPAGSQYHGAADARTTHRWHRRRSQ
jgi:hypothetical protein